MERRNGGTEGSKSIAGSAHAGKIARIFSQPGRMPNYIFYGCHAALVILIFSRKKPN